MFGNCDKVAKLGRCLSFFHAEEATTKKGGGSEGGGGGGWAWEKGGRWDIVKEDEPTVVYGKAKNKSKKGRGGGGDGEAGEGRERWAKWRSHHVSYLRCIKKCRGGGPDREREGQEVG